MSANYSLRSAPVVAPVVALLIMLLMLRPVTMLADDGPAAIPPLSPWSPYGQPNPGVPTPPGDPATTVDPRVPNGAVAGPANGAVVKPGTVTVYEIEASIAYAPLNNSSGKLGYEPIWVPHCAQGRFLEDHSKFELDPIVFKEGIVAIVLIHYNSTLSLSRGGDERLVLTLAHGGRAPIAAAWNFTTNLYWIDPSGPSALVPANATLKANGATANYVIDFLFPGPREPFGTQRVTEAHVLTGTYQVPLSMGPTRACR